MKWDRSKGRPEPIHLLNKIKEIENGDPLVEITSGAPKILILRDAVIPYLRKQVVAMLHEASEKLPHGYQIGVIDAWRPMQRQIRIYEWMWDMLEEYRPGLSFATKRRMVCRFVAPTDQKAPPGHTTGAAVDVNLVDPNGKIVDVWSPYTRLGAAPTYVYGLTPEAEKARMILVDTLLSVGFSNCRDEWWHYSYGDAGWAVRLDKPECYYGKIDLAPELYEAQEREWLERFKERENPFLEGQGP